MKRGVMLLAFLALAPRAHAQETPSPSPAAPAIEPEYELVVGGRSYPVGLGGQVDVKSGGETVAVRLERRAARAYSGDGIAFRFPAEMAVKREVERELATITLAHPDSVRAMIQLFPVEVDPAEVPRTLLSGLSGDLKLQSARQTKPPGARTRAFGDAQRAGLAMEYQVAGEAIAVECYSWRLASRTLAVTLQYPVAQAEAADKSFAVITGSLR